MIEDPAHIAPTTGTLFDPYEAYPADFVAFHAAHPQVLRTLRELALQAKNAGATRIGMKQLYEVARWQMQLDLPDAKPRLNNSWTPYYARLLEETTPALVGMFEKRRLRRVA